MQWLNDLLTVLNENTGVTLILSALGFGFNEWWKTKTLKKVGKLKLKAENIDVKGLQKENELYLIFSDFCLQNDFSSENCIAIYEKLRKHIIDNDLFLREELSKLGSEFADYIIADVANGLKDLQKEEDLLKRFKKLYRS